MKITASAIGLLAAIPSVFGLWPIPTSHTEGKSNSQVWWVDIQVQGQSSPVVRDAVERYRNIINSESFLAPVDYKRGSTDEALGLETDESYTLDASLKAKSPYGVVRGLETFSQLVVVNTPISIKDAPAFPHRGVLFDTSRNWYSVDAVKHTLDAMSYNKLNVLHWHIVDSQSWGIERAAYSDKQLYSYKDIKDIVQYAKNRGIRVIPEFDVPGHTYAVGLSHPEIMSCLDVQPGWDKYAAEPPSGQLNIAKDGSIEFAKKIFKEYAALFPDNVIHVGGDEVNMRCWETDPDVQKHLAANKNETVESLLLSWYGKLHNYDTIVQTWIDSASVPNTVNRGYRAVSSDYQSLYLDCGHGAWLPNWDGNSWCDPFKTWMHVYNYDVLANITDPAKQKLVLGTEVAIWSEQTDEHSFDPRAWPRAAAMAETGWSGKKDASGHVRTTGEVASRLHEQRYRMVGRGVNAEPMQPLWCARNPGRCDLP
ncbi:hypothetical protein DL89DRAFT_267039 [Linderina pennispora]|uniref:beta-N-acetylhexosaminidase n=1 Tax=Linderina pennispora TaxID=61395 RepID=A0A1Y1WCR1_9FUNG|nr:uncharacterized protein DL89DRAFT_267039 [Linderina pennispora]ORX70934.1 hypothetical protein DL89DRAFT_267039 [Linderina pennispora]